MLNLARAILDSNPLGSLSNRDDERTQGTYTGGNSDTEHFETYRMRGVREALYPPTTQDTVLQEGNGREITSGPEASALGRIATFARDMDGNWAEHQGPTASTPQPTPQGNNFIEV